MKNIPLWIAASATESAYEHEQDRLSTTWNMIGRLSEIPLDGDWFKTTLGRLSIFVQRCKDRIVGFENSCAHRFHPLRVSERGNGPIVCPFHHWRYNAEGEAVGIPKSIELFDYRPRDLCKRLKGLDVETCGDLIFARLANGGDGEDLKAFLGQGYGLVAALSLARTRPQRIIQDVATHWKFLHHISLDDYHLVAVHPDTFGKSGYLNSETVQYLRFGRHSVFVHSSEPASLSSMSDAALKGHFLPTSYLIVNIFPNFLISLYEAEDIFGSKHWYASAIRYRAIDRSRTQVESWLYPTTFNTPQRPISLRLRPVIDRIMPPIVAHFASKIMREDNAICAGLQENAQQIDGEQLLGRFETRIGWFEEAYSNLLTSSHQPPD